MGFADPRATSRDTLSGSLWADAFERTLEPGEVLVSEGDEGDAVFRVTSGSLEVVRGPEMMPVDVVAAGGTVGEIAALAGCPRTATVRALSRVTVEWIDGSRYRDWLSEDEHRLTTLTQMARARVDRHRATELVAELLDIDAAGASGIVDVAEWVHVEAGRVVFAEGDQSDAGYLVVSGRLRASRADRHIGEIGRGEVVGEIGLIERAPRSATVTALRDSTLARFSAEAFRAITASHPTLMLQLSRTILARVGRPHTHTDRARSISVTVTAPLDTRLIVTRLANEIARHGTTRHLWAARIEADVGRPGIVESPSPITEPVVAEYLQDVETSHAYLVLETDATVTRWTRQAMSLADRIVVVMSANPDADELHRAETVLAAVPGAIRVERWLLLVHRGDVDRPSGSATIADRLGFDRVAHVRDGRAADLRRLARLVTGNATGLVLGGGGARGFAHLGVWRALWELGVEIDAIGGASIGAPLGGAMALQIPPAEAVAVTTELFHDLLDYTVPVVSLVKGERISRNITKMFGGLDLRDFWLPFFCVSTNLTRSRVEVHDRSDAPTAIRASVALPGILPPVPSDGDLLVDGGVLNNLPCDVMRDTGTVARLIAVDLSPASGPAANDDFGLSVSGWKALRAHIGSGESRYPGLMAIVMRALIAGSVRDRDRMLEDGTVDWYLDLDLRGVQLLDFERVAEIADRGYAAAMPRIEALLAEGAS